MSTPFKFKHFEIHQDHSALKVGTDAMVLGSLVEANNPKHILDVGSGTGVIACMMLQKYIHANVTAIEIDESSMLDLSINLNQSDFSSRAQFLQKDFLAFEPTSTYDLIVSNPPFYENALISNMESSNLAKHVKGLPLRSLLLKSKKMASSKGLFYFIWPTTNDAELFDEIQSSGWYIYRKIKIFGKIDQAKRWVIALSIQPVQTRLEELILRDKEGRYTEDYKQITIDFHGVKL
ncbi:MAG: methyltransferase [Bacteroidetes bacterium]|nr:methyltransferase [Bacteroidota bacterium]